MFLFRAWNSSPSTGRPSSNSQARTMGYKAPLLQSESGTDEQVGKIRSWAHRRERALLIGHSCLAAIYFLVFALYVLRPESEASTIAEKVSLYCTSWTPQS